MRQFKVNDSVTVICESWKTSRNWGHKATVLVNGEEVSNKKITYQNRTWERYQYYSILAIALEKSKVISEEEQKAYFNSLPY